jgi:hypothetical protein
MHPTSSRGDVVRAEFLSEPHDRVCQHIALAIKLGCVDDFFGIVALLDEEPTPVLIDSAKNLPK